MPRQRRHNPCAASRRRLPGLGQLVQALAAQAVDLRGGNPQPRRQPDGNPAWSKDRSPRFAQVLFNFLRRRGPGEGGFRRLALSLSFMALSVSSGQGQRLVRLGEKRQLQRNTRLFRPAFVELAGLGVQRLGGLSVRLRSSAKHRFPRLACKISVGKAAAGKNRPQLLQLLRRRRLFAGDGSLINICGQSDVFRPLHPPLNFDASHAGLLQLLQMAGQRKVFQAEPGLGRAAVKPVRQPAGLGAKAPVAAAPPDGGAEITLARITHTQSAVAKDLRLNAAALGNIPNFLQRQLAGKNDPGKTQLLAGQSAGQIVDGDLRGGVDRQIRRHRPGQPQHAQILDDGGVRPLSAQRLQELGNPRQLPVGEQCIDRHIRADAPQPAIGQGLGQLFL